MILRELSRWSASRSPAILVPLHSHADGAGGKGTWGKSGDEYNFKDHVKYPVKYALDKSDPNYDSSDEGGLVYEASDGM